MSPERFPAVVAEVLSEAGWSEGRRDVERATAAIELVGEHIGRHGAQTQAFGAAVDALTEFGGLYVMQDGPGQDLRRRPFALDPTDVVATAETLADLGRLLDTQLFPLGMEGDHDTVLAIDESGRIFALDHAGVWHLGDTMDSALTTLITGTQPPRLHDDGTW
jgi:hypothetical protein